MLKIKSLCTKIKPLKIFREGGIQIKTQDDDRQGKEVKKEKICSKENSGRKKIAFRIKRKRRIKSPSHAIVN